MRPILRLLRVSLAILCMAICLAALTLWARSATWHNFLLGDGSHDLFVGRFSNKYDFAIGSMRGHMTFCFFEPHVELGESQRRSFYGHTVGSRNVYMYFERSDTATWQYPGGNLFQRFDFEPTTRGFVLVCSHCLLALPAGILSLALIPSWTRMIANRTFEALKSFRIPRRISVGGLLIAVAVVAGILTLIREFFRD